MKNCSSKINRLLFIAIVLLFSTPTGYGQSTQAVDPHGMEHILQNLTMGVMAAVILGTFAFLVYLVNVLMNVQKMRLMQEHGIDAVQQAGLVDRPSLWSQLMKKLTDRVPVEREREILFDHDYDGIRELDNNLPPWWLAMFYVSIIFGFAYLAYYHYFDYGMSSQEAYAHEMDRAEWAIAAYLDRQANKITESNVVVLSEAPDLQTGQKIFSEKCAVCHLESGGGQVGPNLTDPYWIHGGGIKNVFKVIKYGVPEKGMISWQDQIRPAEMQKLASYVLSLQGSNPPAAKAPQGELWEEAIGEVSQ